MEMSSQEITVFKKGFHNQISIIPNMHASCMRAKWWHAKQLFQKPVKRRRRKNYVLLFLQKKSTKCTIKESN